MTFKELLEQERPECVHPEYTAGVKGCPSNYGYEEHRKGLCGMYGFNNEAECRQCWGREIPEVNILQTAGTIAVGTIKDSGERREFETGAVRDIQEGKGRCDLMPLNVAGDMMIDPKDKAMLHNLASFLELRDTDYLKLCIESFARHNGGCSTFTGDLCTIFLEVAKHFEEGAKKYGENNWQKGLPVSCYIDSAVRHYLKWLRGDKDEPHDRAFMWNLMCCIWEVDYSPRATAKETI